MKTHQKIENLYAANPQLYDTLFQHPDVKAAQKRLENATSLLEQTPDCAKKSQSK